MSDQSLPNWLHMFFSLPPDVQDTEWRHAPIYKTTCLLDCYKIPTAASAILTMAQIKAKSKNLKKKHSFSLYSNFNLASSSCPSCSLSLSPLCPRFSILPFSLVFPFPLSPPSPLRVLACSGQAAWQLLHLKNINQCCCGDQIRLPSFIFCPSFPFHRLGLACCCSWSNHEPELVCCSKV